MSSFELTIVTPDGCMFKGETTRVTVRSTEGEVTILGHHINYVAALGMGPATIVVEDQEKVGCCIGGLLSMTNNVARIVATTFEWADEIDIERAKRALQKADERLAGIDPNDEYSFNSAMAKKQRALVRISVAEKFGKK